MANWDAARWRAISAEVDRILDLPPRERDAAVAALRAQHATLADDVARLLAEQPAMQAGRFLEGDVASALPTATATSDAGPDGNPPLFVLQPGTPFGGYRLGRVLGRGGMGVVYEAEELVSGRRVALKVLQRRHDDEYDRERFEREGRLAASIDHQHCVFVFGAEEIAGVPAIAMELMAGTLADRLAAESPLSPAAAVDAARQLVAGLQAANAAGILHRDVKPSNCFVDANGVVKIGDFGISRSTRPTEETARSTRGRFAATPAYASPEQLSGGALDVRADIYSLGATLYELLTGDRPFTRPDLMALLMAVANEPPRAPHLVAPAVPKGLSQIVLRCLAKKPADRFQSYDALAAALAPYASWSPAPATLGRRFLAGAIDYVVRVVPLVLVSVGMGIRQFDGLDQWVLIAFTAGSTAFGIAYYWLCESRWGATLGKAVLGLAVVDAHGVRPRAGVAFKRVMVFIAPEVLLDVVQVLVPGMLQWIARPGYGMALGSVLSFAMLAAQFSTARRRNGYAGVHDLASGTRVVIQAARTAAGIVRRRPAQSMARPAGLDSESIGGGFVVLPGAIEGQPDWRPGYDPRLGRAVWIRQVPVGTPPIEPARAALSRPTRLRWLAGRRTDQHAWDVYEAAAGRTLARALDQAWDWSTARPWLADMARELAAQGAEVPPPLHLDRVWVLDTGRAKLLDDPTADPPDTEIPDGRRFLHDMMRTLRSRATAPWPLSAEHLLRDVSTAPLGETLARLEGELAARPTITRPRRLTALATLALPAFLFIGLIASGAALSLATAPDTPAELRVPIAALRLLKPGNKGHGSGYAMGYAMGYAASRARSMTSQDRAAIEAFLAFRHPAGLADDRLFDPAYNPSANDEDRVVVARARRRIPVDPREGEAAAANPQVRRLLRDLDRSAWRTVADMALTGLYLMLIPTALGGLLLAATCRGVVLRLFGVELVTADGAPASRLRLLARAAIAWSPLFAAVALFYARPFVKSFTVAEVILIAGVVVLGAGAAYALAHPARGIQDRLAGTWIVPR